MHTPTQATWSSALADYDAKRALSDGLPSGDPGEDAALEAYCLAMDHLIENAPAPDLAAVLRKHELATERCDGFGFITEFWQAIGDDIARLAGGGTPPQIEVKPFDPAAWVRALDATGVGYALGTDRLLWLKMDEHDGPALQALMAEITGHPDRGDLVRETIRRRQNGEVL